MSPPSQTELILIRHGETEWNIVGRLMNHMDSPLSPLGLDQAKRLASRMSKTPFDVLYSSDLGRAMSTAQAISDVTGVPVIPNPGLRELALGVFEGLTWVEIGELYPAELAEFRSNRDYKVPGGESSVEFHERTMTCLESIVASHEGRRIVAVAHGGTLRVVFRHVAGLPPADLSPARQLNASLNIFDISGKNWKLRTWGDVSHLAGFDGTTLSANHDAP